MDLYTVLKNGVAIEEVEKYVGLFNTLSDNQIVQMMKDEDIDIDYKEFFMNMCSNRISRLPNRQWVYPLMFLSNKETFKQYYLDRTNELSYTDLVFLLQNMIEPECGLLLVETTTFKKYIEVEKENHGTILQSFLFSAKIYLYKNEEEKNQNFEHLDQIGQEVSAFFNQQESYSEDIEEVINDYLGVMIENVKDMDIHSSVLQKGMDIIRSALSKNIILSPKMLKFYILYMAKELDIEPFLENIYLSMEKKGKKFGDYVAYDKKLTIYYDNIFAIMEPTFDELKVPDLYQKLICNRMYIEYTLHELSHVIENKEMSFILDSKNDAKEGSFFHYWICNGELHLFNEQLYQREHDLFINEVRADLFAMMNFGIQTTHLLKGTFSDLYLANISAYNASRIVDFYTEKTEKGRKVISPVRKFISLYNENMPEEKHMQYIDLKDKDLMQRLMLGLDVPIDIIEEIYQIATGKIVTTNLYEEITKIIDKYKKTNEYQNVEETVAHK